jgi:hypothetical protein
MNSEATSAKAPSDSARTELHDGDRLSIPLILDEICTAIRLTSIL